MKKTPMMEQIATRRALHEAVNKGQETVVSSMDALRAAAMIERQSKANAAGGYGYYGSSYGQYFSKSKEEVVMQSAMAMQKQDVKATEAIQMVKSASKQYAYSYYGGSYGNYVSKETSAMKTVEALENGIAGSADTTANQEEALIETAQAPQPWYIKYKLWIAAGIAAVVLYFTFRKK